MKRKNGPKPPPVPEERHKTVRQSIISALTGHALTARELSAEVGVRESDVYGHLEHIRRSTGKKSAQGGGSLCVTPSECEKCGFLFKKRTRLTRPGRCPNCRSTQTTNPIYTIK